MTTAVHDSQLGTTQHLPLAAICTDGQTQARVKIRHSIVREYAAAMMAQAQEDDWRFPPVIVFFDGGNYWLADGFHRVLAARDAGADGILAEVRHGTQRDALLCSISANTAHGFPRSNADKRNAVSLLLRDSEWSAWSDREIARRCGVSHFLVSKLRKRASGIQCQMRERTVRRGERVYQMDVSARNSASNGEPTDANASGAPPATDLLGIPLAGSMVDIFATLAQFQRARALCGELDGLISQIGGEPAGVLLREHLHRQCEGDKEVFHHPAVEGIRQTLDRTAPYCSICPCCTFAVSKSTRSECRLCQGRGWLSKPAFDSCSQGQQRQVLELRSSAFRQRD
jgi:hypothetical protein